MNSNIAKIISRIDSRLAQLEEELELREVQHDQHRQQSVLAKQVGLLQAKKIINDVLLESP